MSEQMVRFNSLEGSKEFVQSAMKCSFDIDVYFNRIALDAKSILGILSLDPRSVVKVTYEGHNEDFSNVLAKYAVN